MFKNYFRLTFRNLFKNKVSSIINIGGLAVGLATGIVIMLEIVNEVSYDKFNTNLADTYLLMKNQTLGGDIKTGNTTPGLLATNLRAEIPEIKFAARTSQQSDLIRNGDKIIYTNSLYTDADFFKIMSFPAVKGNAVDAFKQPNAVAITETTAMKLFGKTDVIGKLLTLNNADVVNVAAVIRDVPQNSTNQFDIAVPFTLFESKNAWLKKWDDNRIQTWIQTNHGVKLDLLNKKLKALFLRKQAEKNIDLFAYPFSALRLHDQFKNGKPYGGVIDIILLLSTIAGFVLLIACINFMNLATAQSEQRAREVGVRKVLGASRKRIILQFLGEALLLSFLALILGVLLAVLALPAFLQLSGKNFTPDFFNWQLWLLLIILGITTGLVAGSYPAFYLSHFKPIQVLKKMITANKGGSLLRKSLVTFQFVISIFLIIATIVISKQIDYLQERPVGYDPDNLMDIHADTDLVSKFNSVKNELLQIPGVKNVSAGTDNLVRMGGAFNGLEWPGKTPDQDFYITTTKVGYDWVKTAGFQLIAGRDFSPAYGTDTTACLINQAAAQKMGLKEPVVGIQLGKSKVVGVIKDFVFNHPFAAPEPMVVYLTKQHTNHFFVRLNNDRNWEESVAQIEKVIKKTSPDFPFEFEFTQEEYQKNFKEFNSLRQMANLFSGMAIFISCLGLFGLSAFLAERRSKEISIRKILGASMSSVWLTLSKDFLKPVFVAFIIAAPLTGFIMQKILTHIDYHIRLSWWMFAIAALAATVIAVVAISYNGIKAALANPAKSLRSE
jgi:putative ABC transport system permease protein